MLETVGNSARVVQSQVEAWTAELSLLRHDPSVQKFLELQDKIDRTDAFTVKVLAPSPAGWLWPYDLYDVFEFARDLAGRQVSAQALSKVAHGRFPDMSGADRQIMMALLIENGVAAVARVTETGRPASYQFAPLGRGTTGKNYGRLGVPGSELSGLKAEDLEDIGGLPRDEPERL